MALIACSTNNKGGLDANIQTLELNYITWSCECANWATTNDIRTFSADELANKCIFIEPSNDLVELPDTLGYNNDIVRFTGQFYNEKGYPNNFRSFEEPEEARVFRYTEFEVIRSNFRESQNLSEKQ